MNNATQFIVFCMVIAFATAGDIKPYPIDGGYGGIGGGYGKHEIYPPQPYGFGYNIKDKYGNEQYRKESSDGKKVVGSYGFMDSHGIHRIVDYVADEHGFRAKVRTNEPGTANQDPAHVKFRSTAVQHVGGQYR